MRVFYVKKNTTSFLLGRRGENESMTIMFPVADWLEAYPGATIALYNKRPHESESYPVVIGQPENGYVAWIVGSTELALDGDGTCELVAVEGTTVEFSKKWDTKILDSLDGGGDAPDEWESWLTEFTTLKGEAEDAAEAAEAAQGAAEDARDAIEDMGAEATTLAAGSSATVTKTVDQQTGAVTLTFGIPRGGQGDKGDPGDTPQRGTDYWTAEDQAAVVEEAAEDVVDTIIDDTAGDGDTDKTWSADKLAEVEGSIPDISGKADKADPVITGSLSMNRKSGTTVGTRSVAIGNNPTASNNDAFAIGSYTEATGPQSFAEGVESAASGQAAAALGKHTVAKNASQHVFGEYNKPDPSNNGATSKGTYVEIVGNGTGDSNRKNARALDWNGNEYLKGDLYVGCGDDSTGGSKVAKVSELLGIIDDEAGEGDTDKVWSADKSAEEVSTLNGAINGKPDIKDSTETGIDFDVSDEDGNVIVRMKNGDIETKNFNSSYAPEIKNSSAVGVDVDFSDINGNVIARFANGHIQTANFNSGKYGAKVITLKADGTGDFPNLKTALESITDADPVNNPYEIHLMPGTYNTLDGYTDEEIRAADIGGGYTDQSMVGAKTKHGVSIIGDGDCSTVILTAELSTSDYGIAVRGNISTLNWKGTGRFENLTILAKNLRYCVHDDFDMTTQYERIVRNCVFRGTNLAYDPPCTYGAGIAYGGMIGLFENCDFGYDWGLHTRQLMKKDSVIELRNCTGNLIRIGDQSNENDIAHHRYIINNCNFVRLGFSKTNGTTPHIHVSGCGNENMMVASPQGVVAELGNIVKTKTVNLPVGTFVGIASGASYMSKAVSVETAVGVIIAKDSNYDYVQKCGFINSNKLGISGLAIGDYVTVDSDMAITTTGATASNAAGIVKYIDTNNDAYIWML